MRKTPSCVFLTKPSTGLAFGWGNNLGQIVMLLGIKYMTSQMWAAEHALFCADIMIKPSFTLHFSPNPHVSWGSYAYTQPQSVLRNLQLLGGI